MPNVGRQCTGAGASRPSPRPGLAARIGLVPSRPQPVRRLVSALGFIVALLTTVSLPLGYGIVAHLKSAQSLAYEAELTATRAAAYMPEREGSRQTDADLLAAIAEMLPPAAFPVIQRIIDKRGETMLQKGSSLPWPTFARAAPILASGAMIGTVQVSASMRPLLIEVGLVGLVALALGVAAYFAFAVLPLGIIDGTLEKLGTANDKLEQQNVLLDTALDNMAQGLVMYDANERVVFANERFQEMYGLAPGWLQPGRTLHELAATGVAKGIYKRAGADDITKVIRQRVARGVVSHITSRLDDGRIISVAIHPRPGGGWVSTHTDISEREKLNARLEEQNRLLKEQEERLRVQNQQLDTALNTMVEGLAMFDADARIVLANAPYAELYGLAPDQVKPGTTLREVVDCRIAKGLYAGQPPDAIVTVLLQQARAGGVRHLVNKLSDGRMISAAVRPRDDGGWVVTHQDVTEREMLSARLAAQNDLLLQQEAELRAQNERFETALRNMSHGVCMFDSEQRVVMANERYAEIYGLAPGQMRPGTTLRQIIEHRIARGLFAGDNPEDYLKERLTRFRDASTAVHRLSDGRAICVRRQPMSEGGWVTTHEDITERQQLQVRLEQQNQQLDAAMNNMSQGLAMFDDEQRLVVCNRLYADMYGLLPEQVQPGTTVREIVEHRIANGCYATGEPQQLADAFIANYGRIDSQVHELADGRIVNVSQRFMANGWRVFTHEDITERRRSEAKIVHMALHDALTDLPNRVLFNERLEHALTRVRRGEVVAVHLLDLDHFKTVNDTLGHSAGDKLLKMVTQRLHALVRETDTIARMGGDEFAILQVAISHPADATALALRVIEAASAPYDIDGHQVIIGASIGLAVGPTDGDSPDQLIRNADLALYRAKGDGRGTYRFFGPEMDAQMHTRRVMEHDLRKALPAGQFELYYQPVIDLRRDEISGVEALIRWRHPDKGIILPGAFIPVAEEIGFIIPLGEWTIRQACLTASRWVGETRVAVNLSPAQFRNRDFVQVVVSALAASGLAADRLELEITESTLLQDSEATLSTLYQLRALGVRIAMDDFGTGYSSLSYLQSFPFDKIKIDRSFIKDIAEGVGSLNIVRAVTAMARGLGMETTAEGVETKEQLETVRAEGCTEMQGFLFSQPMPASEIEQLLLTRRTPQSGTERTAADRAA